MGVRLSLLSLLRGEGQLPVIFCRPDGTKKFRGYEIPAMNCRAIFECPYGTGSVAREKGRERVKVRGRFGFWVEGTDAKRPHCVPRGAWERGK